ncbi:site-specific DNA-methyltransferase [Ochrobactrum sp. GPK 3]
MSSVKLIPGDNRDSLFDMALRGIKVHSVVTDPPYVMDSVIERFGRSTAAPAQHGRDGAFNRSSRRFIGKTWDASEIAWDAGFWKLVMDVMLPGAFCFAFAGPRTVDRQMSAMRAAGMVIYPLHVWSYATGLPKGHPSPRGDGWYFGAGAPKVDFEPIILAMKPIEHKTYKGNIEEFGTGDLNFSDRESGKFPSTVVQHPKASKVDRAGCNHPTVKPIGLMQYLIRHITPPGGTVLDPFAGSGTTGEAALREGFNCILMEAEPEYIEFLAQRFDKSQKVDTDRNNPVLSEIGKVFLGLIGFPVGTG